MVIYAVSNGLLDTLPTSLRHPEFNFATPAERERTIERQCSETANTLGQPLYAKQEPRKFERGTDLHTQSNPLPMCHRPGVLIKLTVS